MTYDFCFLSGCTSAAMRSLAEGDLYGRLGLMVTPETKHFARHIPSYAAWSLDNSCFARGGKFDGDEFIRLLDTTVNEIDGAWETCRFAVAPDVFDPQAMRGDPERTIERSLPWLQRIRACGVPAALVFQDGLEWMPDDAIPWDSFNVAFIGGGDRFKLGYPSRVEGGVPSYRVRRPANAISFDTALWTDLIVRTLERGKSIHVGRVNSWARICFAIETGASTADGTQAAWGPREKAKTARWLRRLAGLEKQRELFEDDHSVYQTCRG